MGDDDRRTAGDGGRITWVLAGHEHEGRGPVEERVDVGALVEELRRHDAASVQDRVMQGRPFSPGACEFQGSRRRRREGTVVLRTLQHAS